MSTKNCELAGLVLHLTLPALAQKRRITGAPALFPGLKNRPESESGNRRKPDHTIINHLHERQRIFYPEER